MHIYYQTPVEDYLRYYNNQAGFGQSHPGISTFKGPVYQRGNGLGSIFSSLWKAITPLFKSESVRSALKSAGTAALSTGLNIGNDILQGQNFKQSLKRRSSETGANLLEAAVGDLRNLAGSGRKRRKKRQVNPFSKFNYSIRKTKRKPKRKTKRASKKKRKTKRKTKRKSKKTVKFNLFH